MEMKTTELQVTLKACINLLRCMNLENEGFLPNWIQI